ncbi:hypothetical protein [Bradyrhizobium sp. AUGA SZCCT0182]|uniref:hypothetical protein n=1 Tax=Bradyrhizobium sp. AUGA SZCCT0182 TaxID=2807667 RepID=UPI001BAB5A86|nr:hypothetical protein [Bradyrhizobium sp. AUGA SZCCT0182]MBR1238175.1 hypothetical protein [Bradyrhizobium sp. AUGA SZCCT0182]
MSDDTVASLGFAVDSKPLDEAKTKLNEVSTEASKTGKAIDDLNQKAGQSKGAFAGLSSASPGGKQIGDAAEQAKGKLSGLSSSTSQIGGTFKQVATDATAAATPIQSVADRLFIRAFHVTPPVPERAVIQERKRRKATGRVPLNPPAVSLGLVWCRLR